MKIVPTNIAVIDFYQCNSTFIELVTRQIDRQASIYWVFDIKKVLFVFFEASVYANGQNIIENHQSSTDHEFIELGQRGSTNV